MILSVYQRVNVISHPLILLVKHDFFLLPRPDQTITAGASTGAATVTEHRYLEGDFDLPMATEKDIVDGL